MPQKRTIDHIVYTVPNLEEAIDWFENNFGIRPQFGGYHQTQGTKNAVLNLGNACYLEILAVDQDNMEINPPRWMGVDSIEKPQITRWALKSSNLRADSDAVKKMNAEMGIIQGGARTMSNGKLLTWEMIMPLAAPTVEIIPFMVDWEKSEAHPTLAMPQHCELLSMTFAHPSADLLRPTLEALDAEIQIEENQEPGITAKIKTPKGIMKI